MPDNIQSHSLRDGDTQITVLSMGCAVQDWQVAGTHVVLGYGKAEDYRSNPVAMGALCGRVVNRIRNARFVLNGVEWRLPANAPPHHIHGGPQGLGLRNWRMERDGDRAVRLHLHSPHLDQGYPGAVDFQVTLTLKGRRLTYDILGVPDRETPINLAQHVYFNLMGAGTVRNHSLRIAATHHTPNGPDRIPVGQIAPVTGTHYDFRQPRLLDVVDPDHSGWDGNLVLDPCSGPQSEVRAPNGMRLRLWTDQRGLQLYTSNALGPHGTPGPGAPHGPFAGLCLEAQNLPGALDFPDFGSILCTPDRPYRQVTSLEIAPTA